MPLKLPWILITETSLLLLLSYKFVITRVLVTITNFTPVITLALTGVVTLVVILVNHIVVFTKK
jgi:hypothetical protein